MKRRGRMLLWYYMLSKRLFKKYTFLLLLCMIPLIMAAMNLVAGQESGMLTIALYQENPEDALSSALIESLNEERGVLRYVFVEDEEEAYRLVEGAQADAAWLFPDEMQEKLDAYTTDAFAADKLLTIVEREDNVALQLAREKLYGAMYSFVSYSIYENYVYHHFPNAEEISGEELRENYELKRVKEGLFRFVYADGAGSEKGAESHYLTSPLRGMLSLIVLLCGLAAAMYFMQDEQRGVFDMIPLRGRSKFFFAYEFTAMFFAGAALLFAYACSGILTDWCREGFYMLLYIVMCSLFCSIVKTLCGGITRMGAIIPPLMLLILVFCPIFFVSNKFRFIQVLFPPYLYLNAIHDMSFVVPMLLYCVVGFGLSQIDKFTNPG